MRGVLSWLACICVLNVPPRLSIPAPVVDVACTLQAPRTRESKRYRRLSLLEQGTPSTRNEACAEDKETMRCHCVADYYYYSLRGWAGDIIKRHGVDLLAMGFVYLPVRPGPRVWFHFGGIVDYETGVIGSCNCFCGLRKQCAECTLFRGRGTFSLGALQMVRECLQKGEDCEGTSCR